MSAAKQTLLISLAILFAYIWVSTPMLSPYSVQIFAVSVFIYLILKRTSKSKLWHFTPADFSFEMAIITFSFLILIGHTGNIRSIFFPISYIHLFFLIMSTRPSTSVVITTLVCLFHLVLTPNLATPDIVTLVSLPIVALFFMFGKYQHEEVIKERSLLTNDEKNISNLVGEEKILIGFVSDFLIPKINQIKQLNIYAAANQNAILGQLTMIEVEIEKIIANIRSKRKKQ